jgi:integrase
MSTSSSIAQSLTKQFIDSLPTPAKTTMVWDTQPHLALKCRVTGRRTWVVYRSVKGRPVKVTIGPWPSFTVAAAREKARQIIAAQDRGEVEVKAPTLAQLTELYTTQLVANGSRAPEYLGGIVDKSWGKLKHRTIDTITTLELQAAHNDMAVKRGRVAAARAIKVLRTLFNYADRTSEKAIRNSAKRVTVNAGKSRDVYLDGDELKIMHAALDTMAPDPQDYFRLLLLTGQRRSNVAGMRWADINLERAEWVIPAADFKTGKALAVPLVGEVIAILQKRVNGSAWVFPTKSKSGHLEEPAIWLRNLRKRMTELGCAKAFTLHDLRRTHASMLTAMGVPLVTIAKSLGHANVNTTTIYARTNTAGVRRAVESASAALMGQG